ncbi:MAG: M23 family metallopeptidase, partial [Treponema sp.]|nr:M23 family metallopeptidase [Treponema sp.]
MKFFYLFFFACFTFISHAQPAPIKFAIIPETPRPGEPVTISAEGGVSRAALIVNGKRLSSAPFFVVPAAGSKRSFITGVLTIPSTAVPGRAVLRLESASGLTIEAPLVIADRTFVSEVIDLNSALTDLRTEPDPRKNAESVRLQAILGRVGNELHHTGVFSPPVTSTRRTSFFGDRRVFKYSSGSSDTSIHAGVDFGVPTGTPVTSCGAGRVVLAAPRIVTGDSVVIEHLPGVYSLYYHLSAIEVKEGDMVETGTRIGLSGATGLATGPHLHWELRVNGENTDPDVWIARPILDKDAILSKIGS